LGYVEELGSRRFDEAPFGDRPEATDHSGGREGGIEGGREGGREARKAGRKEVQGRSSLSTRKGKRGFGAEKKYQIEEKERAGRGGKGRGREGEKEEKKEGGRERSTGTGKETISHFHSAL
jgi:hypothetical protein